MFLRLDQTRVDSDQETDIQVLLIFSQFEWREVHQLEISGHIFLFTFRNATKNIGLTFSKSIAFQLIFDMNIDFNYS